MSKRISFTKRALENLPLPARGQRAYVYDTKVNGLVLSVTSTGVISFQVYRKLNTRPIRVTLGRYPDMTIDQARKKAQQTLALITEGVNPIAVKRSQRVKGITLGEVFEDYLTARKSLKPNTRRDYNKVMRETFSDWQDKPMSEITRDMVAQRHTKAGKRSEARANNAMRVLRALFNYAAGAYEDDKGRSLFPDNPVTRISHTRAWFRVDRRRTVIRPHELPAWFKAVMNLKNETSQQKGETVRDYLILLLFTGLRREEAAQMKWEQVDLKARTLTITDTKNNEPHILPLPGYILELLTRRRQETDSIYVFPSEQSKRGHLVNAYRQIQHVVSESGVQFSAHDLRRTFITIAESLDISAYALKRLLNHKMNHDVTAGYIVADVERLRKPMQQICDYILSAAGIKQKGEIIPIQKSV